MDNQVSQQELRELAIQYRDSRDPSIFRKILLRINQLLVSIVYSIREKYPLLKKIEKQDLYHAAIIGLYKAVLKVKEEEPESWIITRIIFYANKEIISWAKKPREEPFSSLSIEGSVEEWPPWARGVWSGGCTKQFYDEPIYKNLECSFVRDRFEKLIKEGVLKNEEFDLLIMRFVKNLTYKDIAKKVKCSSGSVTEKIQIILNKLRVEFRKRGWEDDI